MSETPRALLSIHDVMPETLERVAELIDCCRAQGLPMPALLVVPGRAWDRAALDRLRGWEAGGAELVAHGWHHETQPRRVFHRLHAALLSRNVAEHLALDGPGVCALMQRSHDWFVEHGLLPPRTYVPPAWALGPASAGLTALPFRCVETLTGVLLVKGDDVTRFRLPLLGFEADTPLRAAFLRAWNRVQLRSAAAMARPCRIAIHPDDHHLLLRADLSAVLARPWSPVAYRDLHG